MRMKIRAVFVMAVVAVFASALTVPASAEQSGVATLQGSATVGKWFVEDCDKSGKAEVTGRGLYLPGTQTLPAVSPFPGSNGADTREENGVWQFSTAGTALVGNRVTTYALDACGWLGPVVDADPNRSTVAGIGGATCGNSKGHHGQGEVTFEDTNERLKVYDVGWKSSAGGTLPINGRYQEYQSGSTKEEKYGLVAGVVQAQGGDDCLGLKTDQTNNGNGAQAFLVVGVISLVNTDGIEPPDPKEELEDGLPDQLPVEEKRCKGSGAAAGRDGVKKTHDNKPDEKEDCDGGDK